MVKFVVLLVYVKYVLFEVDRVMIFLHLCDFPFFDMPGI